MRVATGTLDSIVDVRDDAGIEPPAITVIGDVADTRDRVVGFLENGESAPIQSRQSEGHESDPGRGDDA